MKVHVVTCDHLASYVKQSCEAGAQSYNSCFNTVLVLVLQHTASVSHLTGCGRRAGAQGSRQAGTARSYNKYPRET